MHGFIPLILPAVVTGLVVRQSSSPTAIIKNGSINGVHSSQWNQDHFLKVPIARPPLGDLRLRLAQPINTTWSEPLDATKYGPACVGYGSDQWPYETSEDCLYVNIVRPSGYENQSLPVFVWIHGGGYIMGSAIDQRYNTSFIIDQSVRNGKPIMAVNIPYRLSGWGFLDSQQIRDAGATNLGIHDQRMSLSWIQENIAAFGGDPDRVTIAGESAGGLSVGIHLIAYGGRDDGLFARAISQSGNSLLSGTPFYNVTDGQLQYENITRTTGCSNSSNSLQCLRELDFEVLNAAFNISGQPGYSFSPVRDGDLIAGSQVDQLNAGRFVHVPYLTGSNTDEGVSFGPKGINNDTAFNAYLRRTGGKTPLDDSTVQTLAAVYPDGSPAYLDVLHDVPLNYSYNASAAFGTQFRRADAFGGDFTFGAARRLTCESWSRQNLSAYCYRFDVRPPGVPYLFGVPHFQDVAFMFRDTEGVGYPPVAQNPFKGADQRYFDVATLMSSFWASFVADGSPSSTGLSGYEPWPAYDVRSGAPKSYFFSVNGTGSRTESDTYRAPGMAYLNTLWKSKYGK